MESKEIVSAIFGATVSLAGPLLVFVGFIYSHAETITLAATRNKHKLVAKIGMLPFLLSLLCAVFCLGWMVHPTSSTLLLRIQCSFYVAMGATAVYGVVAFLFYL
jgi:hypothetical protein